MLRKKIIIKRLLASICVVLLTLVNTPYVYALEAPSAPTAPSSPSGPTLPESPEAPSSPDAPTAPSSTSGHTLPESPEAPSSPDAPTAPDSPESLTTDNSTDQTDGGSETEGSLSAGTQGAFVGNPGDSNTGNQDGGNVGDTTIQTGDATNDALVENYANSNLSSGGASGGNGLNVVNEGNGAESDNSASVSIAEDNTTQQNNSAYVVSNVDLSTNTGDNESSKNVGDTSISTGDANTNATVITSVNTNVDGVAVAEFNVVDDHVGDIILDPSQGCNISSGVCDGVYLNVKNSGNGAGSDNNINTDLSDNETTFQNNDATVENNVTLASNSGDNDANKNTAGDTSIETGDADVSANVLTFANNNIAGDVIYTVVNIFGDLVGDIIMPIETLYAYISGDTNVVNSGNGAGSNNQIALDQSSENNTYQFNNADIANNLVFEANTGDNETNKNTNGNSTIKTGDASVIAQVVNVANLNLLDGNYWLVIVNEAGQWIGKIIGSDGTNLFASDGIELAVGDNGQVNVNNSGNGAGSDNQIGINSNSNTTISQTNNASIINNVNLKANTGDNSASKNTGGDSTITTGDAKIIANIINFVNNNIVGGGKLFVNVINVFGSWIGNFVGPGYEKEQSLADESLESSDSKGEVGGYIASVFGGSSGGNDESSNAGGGSDSNNEEDEIVVAGSMWPKVLGNSFVAGSGFEGSDNSGVAVVGASSGIETQVAGKEVVNVNLAYFVVFLAPFIFSRIKRRIYNGLLAS